MNDTITNPYILNFKKELEESTNKDFLIEREIRQIESYTSSNEINLIRQTSGFSSFSLPKTNSIFSIEITSSYDKEIFNMFYNNNLLGKTYTPLKYDNQEFYKTQLFISANAFADYYKWLKELTKRQLPQLNKKQSQLTHKQKMLALHYLGLDVSKYDNTDSAKILSIILDLDYNNTRQYLSYINGGQNKVRTKSNLETLTKLFDNHNLNSISKQIEIDLEKIKK